MSRNTRPCTSRSVADPNGFWGEMGRRIDWMKPYTKVKNTSFGPAERLDQVVRGRYAQRLGQLHRPPLVQTRRQPGRDHLGGRRPDPGRKDHLWPAARARLQVRQRSEGQRRQEGRPGHDLPADDPGIDLRPCSPVRAHRRRALRRLRRLLAGQPRQPHRGCGVEVHHHVRRRHARRQARAVEEESPTTR